MRASVPVRARRTAAGGYVRYILILRFHSAASLDPARAAFSVSSSLASSLEGGGGGGDGGVGAPQAGGRKLTKQLAKSESDAVRLW